jgi:tetrahydromethanopterin S-methyltransferase subunit H
VKPDLQEKEPKMDMQAVSDAGLAGVLPGTTGQADPWSAYPVAGSTGIATGTGAGKFGFAPIGGTMVNAFESIWDWLNEPFKTPMSPINIGLLVGIVIVSILMWNLILYHIRIAAEAI